MNHPIRPGLHFEKGFACVTVSQQALTAAGLGYVPLIVTSEREQVIFEGNPLRLASGERILTSAPICGSVLDRWTSGGIDNFCKGKDDASGLDLLAALEGWFDSLMDFQEGFQSSYSRVLALWTLATYFHPLFAATPYLELLAPRASGKTKLLTMLGSFAFNATMIVSVTDATVFRWIESCRGATFYDEFESMGKAEKSTLMQIFNCYTRGSMVPRCDGEANTIRFFDMVAPKAFASITGLNATTGSRCIRLPLRRTKSDKGQLEFDLLDPRVIELRDKLYSFCLRCFQPVVDELKKPFVSKLNNRQLQLWKPILILAKTFAPKDWFTEMQVLAEHMEAQSRESSLPPIDLAVLQAVERLTRPTNSEPNLDREMTATDLKEHAAAMLDDEFLKNRLTAQKIGLSLARLGLEFEHRSNGNYYKLYHDQILLIGEAYDVTF